MLGSASQRGDTLTRGLEMLDAQVEGDADRLREEFRDARPFRHVVMRPFLRAEAIEDLAREFPAFEDRHATNEFGKVGRKASRPDMPGLGPAYRRLDGLLRSKEFLALMTRITAIPNLLYDPEYIGGGTHENLVGNELDPHVDFNYHPATGWHRRLNLILFVHHTWDESWGGCLDLHRDPWSRDDEFTSIVPHRNHCVLFETTECSWHGFRRIEPPADHVAVSRKSIAVYFYTKQRPPDETAPSHATVYVQRKLPEHIVPGYELQASDVQAIENLFERRDQQIRFLYEREKESAAILGKIIHSPTFRLSQALVWPAKKLRDLFRGG